MKNVHVFSMVGSVLMVAVSSSGAQDLIIPAVPANPTDFETRNLGDSKSAVATSTTPPAPKKIKVSYTAVSASRTWTNTKGVTVQGRLIAYEEGDFSQSNQLLTVVKDGKVRLLVDGKSRFSDVPLTSFISADQEFVKGLVEARKLAAEQAKAAAESAKEAASAK